ncbi:MAG: flippase [Phototrophicaceae bacterium]
MDKIRQRLSKNTLALLLSNGGSVILSFVLSILIGRLLGEEGLGVYASVLAWIFPLSLVTEFGLGTLITRDIAQNPQNAHAYLRASVSARLIIGGLLVLITWLTAPYLSQDDLVVQGLRLSSPMIIILPFYSSFTAIFRAREIMHPIAWLNLGMLIAQVTLTVIALYFEGDILVILAVNVITSAGQLIGAWAVYRKWFYTPSKHAIAILPLLKASTPFAIAAILAAIQTRASIILLEQFTTTQAVGYYTAASRFVEAGRLIPHAFFDALFPLLAGLAKTPEKLKQLFRRVILGLVIFGVLFASGITLISKNLILWTYGENFAPAIPILIILSWGLLPMLLKGGRTLYWYAQGQENYVNVVTAIVIIIQISVAFWLIPEYGAIGAGWVLIIAETSALILLFARRT